MKYLQTIIAVAVILLAATLSYAGNIDPDKKLAWGENVGWINSAPVGQEGIVVTDTKVSGLIWSENIGWINLSPSGHDGVINDGNGNLSGYAWSENCGWLNFTGVEIDPATGIFSGHAWGENIGWVSFLSDPAPKRVVTTWKKDGDINGDGKLDLADAVIALQITVNIGPAETVHHAADVNGNDKIGIEESVYILEKVSGIRE